MDTCQNCSARVDYACDWGWCRECIARRDTPPSTGGFVLRNTTPPSKRNLPASYHTYIAWKDGQKVAFVQRAYRPKNAGGTAWQAKVKDVKDGGREVTVYSSALPKLCEIIRYVVTNEGQPPAHWR